MKSAKAILVSAYYRMTWRFLIIVDAGLALLSEVTRPFVSIPFFLIALTIMSPYAASLDQRRRPLTYAIVFALFALAVEHLLTLKSFEDLVPMMLELICGSLPLLLLNHSRPRAYWLSLLNAIVIGVGSITFASSIVVYTGFLLLTLLLLLNLNAANLYLSDWAGQSTRAELAPGYFRQFLYVTPVGLASAVVIFLAFPRVQSLTMTLGNAFGKNRVGYSGQVTLSGGGDLQESQATAFMVESKDLDWLKEIGSKLHFRGDALDTFDGVKWTSTIFAYESSLVVQDTRMATKIGPDVHQVTVQMEPTGIATIFYPGVLVGFAGQSANAGPFLFNSNGSVLRETKQGGPERFSYSVQVAQPASFEDLPRQPIASLAIRPELAERSNLLPHELGVKDMELYLHIPEAIKQASYFRDWLAEVNFDPEKVSIPEVEEALKTKFKAKFQPTLENSFSDKDAFKAFLTTDRRGHCEYFSTAAVLTLRALGVPARVAVGYYGGIYNSLIDALEVREDHAHAWVEVFVPGVGWHPFDPTPGLKPGLTANLISSLRLYTNALGFWFRTYVIDYNGNTQLDLLKSLKKAGQDMRSSGSQSGAVSLKGMLRPVGALLLILLLAWFFYRRMNRSHQHPEAPLYFEIFAEYMAKRGMLRAQGETYESYLKRARAHGIDQGLLQNLGRALERDLYAQVGASEEEALALTAEVRRLVQQG